MRFTASRSYPCVVSSTYLVSSSVLSFSFLLVSFFFLNIFSTYDSLSPSLSLSLCVVLVYRTWARLFLWDFFFCNYCCLLFVNKYDVSTIRNVRVALVTLSPQVQSLIAACKEPASTACLKCLFGIRHDSDIAAMASRRSASESTGGRKSRAAEGIALRRSRGEVSCAECRR